MKYIILLLFFTSFGCIFYGFSLEESQSALADKFIGGGTLLLFLVVMPLFLLKVSKGKKFKDYMLTDESVRRMQGKEPKNPEDPKA
jgi:hypothetical protein